MVDSREFYILHWFRPPVCLLRLLRVLAGRRGADSLLCVVIRLTHSYLIGVLLCIYYRLESYFAVLQENFLFLPFPMVKGVPQIFIVFIENVCGIH